MAHYAELNENNEVIYVAYMDNEIITDENGNEVEQLGIDHLHHHHGNDRLWVRTSYTGKFRKRYAGIGYTYNQELDAFILPKPYDSWILNKETADWESPLPKPDLSEEQIESGYFYIWDEESYKLDNSKGWILCSENFSIPN